MDEFVNWDHADPAASGMMDLDLMSPSLSLGAAGDPLHDLDLALENAVGDDFSFWALQHFENSNPLAAMAMDPSDSLMLEQPGDSPQAFDSVETPDAPCTSCQAGGYQCKRMREGKYKGYCTSCIALRCYCSFGSSGMFPSNPWPLMGDHPDAIAQEDVLVDNSLKQLHTSASESDLANLASAATAAGPTPAAGPKIGARFSRESVKILKNWLSTHSRHPYPTEDEKDMLQKQTGLNKTQITNWLANSRRRRKMAPPRSTSPGVRSWTNAIDIPQRRGTPASFEHMNPLQRWQNSPPENEPASVTAIARAVTASTSTLSSGLNSPYSLNFTDDGSGRSLCAVSSASSANTSHSSGGSFASAYSHMSSRGSFGSLGSMNRGRRRRRRKGMAGAKGPEQHSGPLIAPPKTFQCTFCTETFRTKHDWQRHEKSLHLSLERWVCTPEGPRAFNPENGQISCVFCGEANPDDAHVESHNHSACQERTLPERTFYRKDHLRQHLKLVHRAKFVNWSMEQWRVSTPEIRSRCGFCGIVMDTWTIRVDHLAEHFKTGYSMADWKGDWGFETPVLDMVENSIPPWLIHDERNTPYPYEATQGSPESARNAYELIKSELLFYIGNRHDQAGTTPTDEELQLEACRIIFGAEVISKQAISSRPSWLRDLLLSSDQLTLQAQLAPIRSHADSRQAQLKINGKDTIFDDDPMELQLHEFVKARSLLGLTAMDDELQVEACTIIGRMEESSSHPSDEVANFLLRLIYSSTQWLVGFRQRAVLPRSEDVQDEAKRSKDPNTVDSTIHNYSRLDSELAEYVRNQRSLGHEPSDDDLQKRARIIIYEFDDEWNQTAADNAAWLAAFKQRQVPSESSAVAVPSNNPVTTKPLLHSSLTSLTSSAPFTTKPTGSSTPSLTAAGGFRRGSPSGSGDGSASGSGKNNAVVGRRMKQSFSFNDSNCYRFLARELTRYVASVMSPNNPNSHVPSDDELQYQARWILYDDDDPWNQTEADDPEWLQRFKRQVGILTDPSPPGLPDRPSGTTTKGPISLNAPPYSFMFMKPGGQMADTAATTSNNVSGKSTQAVPMLDGGRGGEPGLGAETAAMMPDPAQLDDILQDLNFDFDFGELMADMQQGEDVGN